MYKYNKDKNCLNLYYETTIVKPINIYYSYYLFNYLSFNLHTKPFGFHIKCVLIKILLFIFLLSKIILFYFSFNYNILSNMLSFQELLNKFSIEVFENNFHYNYTSMTVSI